MSKDFNMVFDGCDMPFLKTDIEGLDKYVEQNIVYSITKEQRKQWEDQIGLMVTIVVDANKCELADIQTIVDIMNTHRLETGDSYKLMFIATSPDVSI